MQAFLDRLIAQGVFGSLPTAFVYTGMMFLFGVLVVFFRPIADITSLVRVAGHGRGHSHALDPIGSAQGALQWLADSVKLLLKEDLCPDSICLNRSISAQNFAGWTAYSLNKFFFELLKEFCFCVAHALSEHGSEPFHSHPFRMAVNTTSVWKEIPPSLSHLHAIHSLKATGKGYSLGQSELLFFLHKLSSEPSTIRLVYGEIFDPEHILRNTLRHQNAPDLPPGSFRERGDESLPDLRVG